jgi:hypothetical protein
MNFSKGDHWLNRERLTVYPRSLLAIFLILGLEVGFFEAGSKTDFHDFWLISQLALAGQAVSARWLYPPTFYLVILPLGLLPYSLAYISFMLTTLGCYVVVIRRIIPAREALWCLATFGSVWFNLRLGQNGFLTAALAGAALLSLERRPILAGVFIGFLSIKPHLGLLFPLALIAIGAWRTFFTAVVVILFLMGLSVYILGVETLMVWLHNMSGGKEILELGTNAGGGHYWPIMPTVFVFLRLMGLPLVVAYAGHGLAALGAITAMWKVWRHSQSWPLRGAVLIIATLIATPYLNIYDLTWLALPIAWITQLGLRDGWLKGEREVLVCAWLLPIPGFLIAWVAQIQLMPLILLALLWVILRRSEISTKYEVR